jgi:hypothetical protein
MDGEPPAARVPPGRMPQTVGHRGAVAAGLGDRQAMTPIGPEAAAPPVLAPGALPLMGGTARTGHPPFLLDEMSRQVGPAGRRRSRPAGAGDHPP